MFKSQLLNTLFLNLIFLGVIDAQLITQPPESAIAALGTNATFTCRGNGDVFWEIDGTQVLLEVLVPYLALEKMYVPLPTPSFSQLIMTATEMNNFTRTIQCLVDSGNVAVPPQVSDPVHLLVYAEPHPPSNLVIEVDGLNLVATWTEPFSLEGEEIFYIVSVTNKGTGATAVNITLNETTYIFMKPLGARKCEEYLFTVFSRNDFFKSITSVVDVRHIPAEPLLLTRSDVSINVSLFGEINVTVTVTILKSADPCPSYPVSSYIFNITEQDGNTLTASIRHTSTLPLIVDDSNGLVPDQVYRLVIEAENSVGSTLSEEILIYTTGLQSVLAVMELNGSITVTCSFATGASSTGCLVTILNEDSLNILFTVNITRQNGYSQVIRNIELNQEVRTSLSSQNVELLVQAVELLRRGEVGSIEFNSAIIETPATTNYNPMRNESTWKTAVILTVVLVVVFTLVASAVSLVCYKVGIHNVLSASCRNSETQVVEARTNTEFQFINDSVIYEDINDETIVNTDPNFIDTTPNVVYGFSTDSIKTTPNKVYGVNIDGLIETTPNEVYGVNTDGIKTTPNEVYGVNTDGIKTTPNEVCGLLRK